jgi:DNA polymerase-3 subunit delta
VTTAANGGAGVWLVEGDDPSLVAEGVSNLVVKLLGPADRSLALEDFHGEELDLAAVVDACRTPPFLADRRVLVVRDIGRLGVEQLQPLLAYLEEPMPTSHLVLAAGGGQVPARLVSAVKQRGGLLGTTVKGKEAHGWLAERLGRASVVLEPSAAAVLESHLGEDLGRLGALLATLEAAYGEGARIGTAELSPYLGQPGSVPPWDLTDAIDAGDDGRALTCLHRLLEAGERHPLVVTAILHRHFGNALRAQSPVIRTEAQAAEAIGISAGRSTFPARKALDTARRLGPRRVGDAVLALADAELALKGRLDWPEELVLEVLVARLCQLSRRATGGAPARAGQRR